MAWSGYIVIPDEVDIRFDDDGIARTIRLYGCPKRRWSVWHANRSTMQMYKDLIRMIEQDAKGDAVNRAP